MHTPVLLKEAVEGLALNSGDKAIDCTFGDGGHTKEILKQVGKTGKVLALDVDAENIKKGIQKFSGDKNLVLVNDNFVHLKEIAARNKLTPVQGILMDLGWSTTQFEESGRGFSFLKEEPLDMRLGESGITAAQIINTYSEKDLGKIFREYGEERNWKEIAREIVDYRRQHQIKNSNELAFIIESLSLKKRNFKINPATKIFQALRLAVNDELNVLKRALPQTLEILSPGGRLAIISFHSLEDRIVKHFFQEQADKNLKIINKKPVTPAAGELQKNPRSRSAKLRIAEKI